MRVGNHAGVLRNAIRVMAINDSAGDIPSLEGAAEQIKSLKQLHQLDTVFLATDATLKGVCVCVCVCVCAQILWLPFTLLLSNENVNPPKVS